MRQLFGSTRLDWSGVRTRKPARVRHQELVGARRCSIPRTISSCIFSASAKFIWPSSPFKVSFFVLFIFVSLEFQRALCIRDRCATTKVDNHQFKMDSCRDHYRSLGGSAAPRAMLKSGRECGAQSLCEWFGIVRGASILCFCHQIVSLRDLAAPFPAPVNSGPIASASAAPRPAFRSNKQRPNHKRNLIFPGRASSDGGLFDSLWRILKNWQAIFRGRKNRRATRGTKHNRGLVALHVNNRFERAAIRLMIADQFR